MKNLFITLIITLISITAFSQTKNEVDLFQATLGVEKEEIVINFVKPSEEQKAAFMEVYNKYETERKELGKQRITLLNTYAEQWENMTNEQADEWTTSVLKLGKKRDALIKKYYTKVKKVTDAKVATQFFQIEQYILTMVRYSIFESIPFVGEK